MSQNKQSHVRMACGAKTRSGNPCQQTIVAANGRCKKHGANAGAPPGNQNAVGHGAPAGNKNALTTGAAEAIWLDQLDEPEKTLVGQVETEKLAQINDQIRLTGIRIRRMMERIARLKAQGEATADGLSVTEITESTGGQNPGTTTKRSGILGQIQDIENALTRVQGEMRKLLDSKHRMEMDGSSMNGDDEDFDGSLFAGGDDEDDEEGSTGD